MYFFLINPASRSGRGVRYWKKIQPLLQERGLSYNALFSEGKGHVTELTRSLEEGCGGRPFHLVALGGDGTVNEVIQGVKDFSRFTLSYIPTGSSNDFARDLGISREPLEALAGILENRHERYMDMGILHYDRAFREGKEVKLCDRRFMAACGVGFDAAVCEEILHSSFKEICNKLGLGKLSYLGIALKQLLGVSRTAGRLILDEGETVFLNDLLLMVVMVHRYEGGGFMFCPQAKADDGLLDICIGAKISRLRMLRILPTVLKGKHLGFAGVSSYRAREVCLVTQRPLWVHTDGEVEAQATAISLRDAGEKVRVVF